MSNMTREHGPDGEFCFHLININLILVETDGLVGIRRARSTRNIAGSIFAVHDLIDHGNSNSFRMGCRRENGCHSVHALPIAVTGNCHEDSPLVERTFVTTCITARFWIGSDACSDGKCTLTRHELIFVDCNGVLCPKSRYQHCHVAIGKSWMLNFFECSVFVSNGNGPSSNRSRSLRCGYFFFLIFISNVFGQFDISYGMFRSKLTHFFFCSLDQSLHPPSITTRKIVKENQAHQQIQRKNRRGDEAKHHHVTTPPLR
mmetsp:Transcript_7375/g.11054  ORF Transcript_7375/g.11054 Transcript_7375/m.11054 type:complete len:259 (+) Transcript_7375:1012-1788(+)